MKSIVARLTSMPLVQTALAHFGFGMVTLLLPLVTVPYLTRVLGPEKWGVLSLALAIGMYLILVIDYSLTISATREVARSKDDSDRLASIVSGVLGTRLLLTLLCALFLGALQLTIPLFREMGVYLWLALYWSFGFGMMPMFYFQGTEQVPRILRIDIPLRIVSVLSVFPLVRNPGDGWLALFLQGSGGVVIMIVAYVMIYREIPFRKPTLSITLGSLRDGRQLSLSRIASSTYWMSNPVILGMVAAPLYVGFFSGADRVIRAILAMTEPITLALFPRSSQLAQQDENRLARVVTLTTAGMLACGLLIAGILYVFAPLIIRILLGPGFESSVPLLRILAVLVPIICVTKPLVMQWMIPLGMDRSVMWISVIIGAIHIPVAVILAMQYRHTGAAIAFVSSESINLTATLIVLYVRKQLPFIWMATARTSEGHTVSKA
jgi:PST family polysaccharide transporter